MKEELISFETAKLAYEKGYTREVVGVSFTSTRRNYYNTQGELNGDCTDFIKDVLKYGREKAKVKHVLYPATSQSLLQKWLREEKDIFVTIDFEPNIETESAVNDTYTFKIIKQNNNLSFDKIKGYGIMYDSYEEALEEALQKALKLIK